jgi:hypothetical protein
MKDDMMLSAIPRQIEDLERELREGTITRKEAQVVHLVAHFLGYSLRNHGSDLRKLLARDGVDNPSQIADVHVSDCGLFGLGVWHRVDVHHPLMSQGYVIGMAIAWLYEIARDLGAIRFPHKDGPPKPGALMHYFHDGKPDNHVEFCLSHVQVYDSVWLAHHGGGGRALGAIAAGHSNILWNADRPLQEWYDIDTLCEARHEAKVDGSSDGAVRPDQMDPSESEKVVTATSVRSTPS